MKLLVTGASGLVGSEIVLKANKLGISESDTIHKNGPRISQILKLSLNPIEGFISADISSEDGMKKIEALDFDAVIHCAAWRDPDRCLKNKEAAFKLNFESTKRIAEIAASKKAYMIYISTDYVFDGKNPPFSEDSTPSPVNHYGYTKLLGEKAVSEVSPDFAILRIPLQYGVSAGIDRCPLLMTSLKALHSEKDWPMEDSIVRYPTYSGDVADALIFMLSRSLNGIYHMSGQDKTTRYRLTLQIGEILGLNTRQIIRLSNPPAGEEARPHDSHLSIDKLLHLGFNMPIPFAKRIDMMKDSLRIN